MKKIKSRLSLFFLILFLPMVSFGAECTTFTDIDSSSYKSDILYASDKGWVSCKDTFNPLSNTTRREAIAMALLAGGHNPPDSTAQCFDDIVDETWARKYICYAKDKGIITANASFRPADDVSFQEASAMILNSMTSDSYTTTNDPDTWGNAYLEKMSYYGFTDDKLSKVERDYFTHILRAIELDPNKQPVVVAPKMDTITLSPTSIILGESIKVTVTLNTPLTTDYSVNASYSKNDGTIGKVDLTCSGTTCSKSIIPDKVVDNKPMVISLYKDGSRLDSSNRYYSVTENTPTDPVDPTPPTPIPTISISSVEASPSSVNKGESIIYIANLSESITSGYSAYLKFTDTTVSDELMTCNGNKCAVSRVMNGVGIDRPFRINLKKDAAIVSFKDGIYSVVTPDIPMIREVKVNPTTALEGESFNFSATLTSELLTNQSVKYQLEADAEDVYLNVTDVPCVALECKIDRVITKARYNRKVRFGVFEGDKLISTGWQQATYNVDADPFNNAPPVFEEAYVNRVGGKIIPLGRKFKFYTRWSDADGDAIVIVKIRYRKVGSSTWSEEVPLRYYKNFTFLNTDRDLQIDEIGMYEFQAKSSDKVNESDTLIHTTDWITIPDKFEVTDIIKPILNTDRPSVYMNSSGLVSFNLQVIDDDNDIDRIDVDWSGMGLTVEAFTNLQSEDVIEVSHNLYTTRTVTATAYDKAGNKSNMVKVRVTVKPPYIPPAKTYYPNYQTNIDGSTQCEGGTNYSVGFASGAEKFSLSFLNQKGLNALSFNLSYNSLLLSNGNIANGWSTSYGFNAHIQGLINGDVIVYWNAQNYNLFEKSDDNITFISKDKITKYDKLVQNADKSYTLTKKNGMKFEFDKYGTLESISNKQEQKLGFIFDENSSLTRVTDVASGLFIEYHYENNRLVKVSDSIDREVILTYSDDNASNLIKIEAPENISYTFEYNEIGQVTKYIYGDGTTHFKNTYLDNGLVESEDDGIDTNQVMLFTFDHESDPTKIITTHSDRNGDISKYEFDSQSCNMLSMIDKLNNKTTNTFDDKNQLTSSTNAKNQTVNIEYNDNGDVTKKISPDGSYEELVYDEHKNLISHSLLSRDGSEKFTTTYEYDTNNNLIKETAPNGDSSSYEYNEDNLLVSTTSPKGNSVSYEYDEYKRVKTITYPNGKSTSYRYDTIGRVIKQIDQLGNEVRFIYDNADRVVEIINALGNSATITYDQRGNRLTATDPKGNSSTYTYDANNNLLTQTNPLGAVTTFAYDGEDRVIKVTDANGNSVSFEYDAMGRVIKSTDAMGNSSSVEYDALGNVKKSYDAMGNMVAELFYDNKNNLIKAVDSLNQSTQTSYNLMGQPESITDAKSRVSKFNYDKVGRLIEAIDTMNGKSTQSYDADGNRVDFADPKANKTSYTYNNLGLPTSITTASGSTTSFAYNDKNLLNESINGRGQSSTIIYNNDSSIYSIKDEVGTILYSYDENGNVLTISENGKTITMTYSTINQLLSYTDSDGNTITYEYDLVGNLTKLIYPDGKAVSYSYNANNQLSSVTDSNSKTTSYEYDKNSRVVKITRPNGTILTREYNNANQLTSQKDVTPSGAVISEFSFRYDEVGNIIEETNSNEISPKALANIEMSYLAGNLLDEANSSKAVFDADDNMLELANLKLSYDSRNRLVSANDVMYSYDVLNNKIAKDINGATNRYITNPNAPLRQLLSLTESDNSITTYTYGLGLISQTKADNTLYYHYDLRGSTIALTDESGEIVDRFSYLPYGELYKHSLGTTVTPFLYNGRDGVMNEENNLYYMRARFYSTVVKRFVNRDSLIGGISNFGSLNRFGYVSGNSVSFIDPTGNVLDYAIDPVLTSMGLAETYRLYEEDKYLLAAIGTVGSIYDLGATVFPFIPAGAGVGVGALERTITKFSSTSLKSNKVKEIMGQTNGKVVNTLENNKLIGEEVHWTLSNGGYTKIDQLYYRPSTDDFMAYECKYGKYAKLTPNQKLAQKEIPQSTSINQGFGPNFQQAQSNASTLTTKQVDYTNLKTWEWKNFGK